MIQRALLLIPVLLTVPLLSHASDFIAVSLSRAAELLQNGDAGTRERAMSLAGITRPHAILHDTNSDDLIVVGERNEHAARLTLDDWAVAARSEIIVGRDPMVSIDETPETARTGMQAVRFEGALPNTQFGADLLAADIVLKHLGLGKVSARIFGVESFLDLTADTYRASQTAAGDFTRFWFLPMRSESYVYARDGVVIVDDYRIDIQTQRYVDGEYAVETDPAVTGFSEGVRNGFADLKVLFPELGRMEQLYYLTALAQGLGVLGVDRHANAVKHWLGDYRIRHVETPSVYPREENSIEVTLPGGRVAKITFSGGIDLDAMIVDLEDGVPDAVRQYVLASRPDRRSLDWEVPLVSLSWSYNRDRSAAASSLSQLRSRSDIGMSLRRQVEIYQGGRPVPLQPPPVRIPSADFTIAPHREYSSSQLPSQQLRPLSSNVGGVMLSGTAQAAGEATADLSGGQFALIIDGQNARLDPAAHCRFVTALWAVYFGNTVPGISIDPIYQDPQTGFFSDKHLVRYIGRVVNTDLGRVMREADYLMKKWSVGTERASIRGFRTPDDYSGRAGTFYASLSRFWLTPEDMTFNASEGMLLFDRGNMAVKTEVLGHATGSRPSDPHNEAFARFFTENYDEIAEKYPVFRELSDYGKMVALSRYLKDSGIPLLWYLLAHKDDVLTEDSPGTVDNLAKDSDYWRGVTVQGGVNLSDQGQFVYDETAIRAIREAQAQYQRAGHTPSGEARHRPVVSPVSFETARSHYTVVPQHSLTSGRDRAGNRYQTDFCLRAEGYRVTDEVVDVMKAELVRIATHRRYSSMTRNLGTDEILRRHEELLISAYNQARRETALMHSKVDALRGREFSGEAECEWSWNTVAGTDSDAMELQGLFVQQCHYVTNLELVRYFNPGNLHGGEFGDGWRLLIPYRIRPADDEMRDFLNVRVPVRMAVENILTGNREVLRFCTETYTAAAYVPDNLKESALLGLFLLSDASMRLSDKMGSRFEFDPAGDLVEMSLGDTYSVRFTYSDSFTDRFDEDPYYLEPVPGDWVTRGDVQMPERMRLVPVSGGEVEVFRASQGGEYLGYVPEQPQRSRYEFLAIMTDASFRLIGRDGSEFAFFSNGEFDSWIRPDAERLIQSISSGAHTVDFEYTMDNTGTIRISTATVRGGPDRDDGQDLIVRYRYDDRGRLLMASR